MSAATPVRTADVTALRAALDADPTLQLVDVRTTGEYRGGHVPGARLLSAIGVGALDRARPVWLICRSGARSAGAAQQLARQGFETVNVEGGTLAWRAAGHAVEGDATGPNLLLPLIASLTLGLAPFTPEPHIVGKLRWLAGGAEGMGPMDWFDVALHGAPWLWLIGALIVRARSR